MFNGGEPLVTVCIANFNGEHLLGDCIESVLSQQGSWDIEIIVHDDASTDGSLEVLSRYRDVNVIRSDRNVGFCVANNRMVEAARGKYILLLNNDAELWPDAISALIAASNSLDPSILSLPQYDWESRRLVDRGCLLDPFHVPVPNTDPSREQVGYVIGACLWLRRQDWLCLGGFPEWMGSIGEDLYLCIRARLEGFNISVPARSGYLHRQGASFGGNRATQSGLSTNLHRRYLSERNRAAVVAICTPGLLGAPLMVVHLCVLAIEGFLLCILNRSLKPWTGIYGASIQWLYENRRLLMRVRKDVQRRRRVSVFGYVRGTYTWQVRKLSMFFRYGLPKLKS